MKAFPKTFELQTSQASLFPHGLTVQRFLRQEQIQGMFDGFGFAGRATFEDFEGKANA